MTNTISVEPFSFGGTFNNEQVKNSNDIHAGWIDDPCYPTLTLNSADKNTMTLGQLKCYVDKYELAQQNLSNGILITYAGRADGSKCFFDFRTKEV